MARRGFPWRELDSKMAPNGDGDARRRGGCLVPACGSRAADVDPLSGIDFVHIADPGNAPWMGDGTISDNAIGRGSVEYDYYIGRTEVNTAQWVEFFNAAFDRPDPLPHLIPPTFWGATSTTPNTPGGRRWTVPASNENRLVGNISWRMAAMYCNWLTNGKSSDRSAFLSGAYEVSTFGYDNGVFTDQLTRSPGARYFIPTWDEWLKAAHYDPNRNGPGEGGWWVYSDSSDDPLIPGPPGVGEANFGFPGGGTIPLGAYPEVQSPWGLLDLAGGTTEWNETALIGTGGIRVRVLNGSYWSSSPGFAIADSIYAISSEFPNVSTGDFGFRIAAVVPAPGVCAVGLGGLVILARRSSRQPRPGAPT